MKEVQALYDSLKVVRRASEDDPEVRRSDDHKIWGVRLAGETASQSTFAVFAGTDAKDYACDLADYEADDDADDEDEDDEDDGEEADE
jgi:hypothetical protein